MAERDGDGEREGVSFTNLDQELFRADATWDDVRTVIIRFDDDMPGIASWHAVAAR